MLIAGVDEAGRGCALGPLVIAIAVIDKKDEESLRELNVRDSKDLSPNQRTEIYKALKGVLVEYKSVQIPAGELNELMARKSLNEIEAIKMAFLMKSVRQSLGMVIIDCPDVVEETFVNRLKAYVNLSFKVKAEHHADSNHLIVGAASIIAKVERDRAIERLHEEYGDFGSGYSHDEKTIAFIKRFVDEKNELPSIARTHWITNQKILNNKLQTNLSEFT